MKNIFKITILASFVAFFVGCETVELELLDDPNNLAISAADPNFVLNDVQINFSRIFSGYNGASDNIMRHVNMFSTYNGSVNQNTLDFTNGEWQQSYKLFTNLQILQGLNDLELGKEESGEGGSPIPNHVGVAQVLAAYSYMLLVDYLGDVPFTEANQPEEFPNPNTSPGSEVYMAQLELLDEAISNLNASGDNITGVDLDLYFGSFDASNWVKLANTLKIRAYLNLRLTQPDMARAGINAAIGTAIIDDISEDFQFQYSDIQQPTESRHPYFTGNYLAAGAGTYMSNGLYDMLNVGDAEPPFVETGTPDPRARYYIYRQTTQAPNTNPSNLPCAGDGRYEYCYVGNLYWGRDHADDAGIPNDTALRTTFGVYPAGGAFDADQLSRGATTTNMGGAGIQPIYLSSFTHFALAEAALTLGTSGNAATLLEEGIRLSMDKVTSFPTIPTTNPSTGEDFAATAADINSYVSRVMTEYNAASSEGKLAIISREYYLAAFGCSPEAYNTYRRTGYPNLQDPIIPAGPFPRNFRYPGGEVATNPNIGQQALTTTVFWDNNPSGFID